MLGLKRGTVQLCPHETAWEENAAQTIQTLRRLLGDDAIAIQHVGSTSITHIQAKPIIDIAVAVRRFEDVEAFKPVMEANGFIYRPNHAVKDDHLFVCGDWEADTRTHHIHVVLHGSAEWRDYLFFRDYLNAHPETAREYEALKMRLMAACPGDREAYTQGKAEWIQGILRKAE